MLLGIDIGTTHCKAGLFETDGTLHRSAHCPTPTCYANDGSAFYDPDELWATVAATIREVTSNVDSRELGAVGIASMAETGLLIDQRTGEARTPLIPWFDPATKPVAERIAQEVDLRVRFFASGQYPSFKSALARLLWLRSQQPGITDGARWLSTADYIAYRLTGIVATDYTLAARTYAFNLNDLNWDESWLREWELPADLFPQAQASGTTIGHVGVEQARQLGLRAGTPVVIAGHDHVCGALAVGAVDPGCVFDSIGTAETLLGAVTKRALGQAEYDSGLTFGPHVVPDRLYWMGGLSTAGGSVEWLRATLGDPPLSYDEFQALVAAAGSEPTEIIYFPYLLGSGTPHSDALIRGAFIGVRQSDHRAQLAKATLEGIAYELEFIRRVAQTVTHAPIDALRVAGGGTRNRAWMQIKADVSGCRCETPTIPDATLLGAALLAGIGSGVYHNVGAAARTIQRREPEIFVPDERRHESYRQLYEQGFLPLQQPLRQFSRAVARQK